MPLSSAVYVSSNGKIYGMMGPYLLQFDSITGAYEDAVLVTTPAQTHTHVVYHANTGLLYVSVWNSQTGANSDGSTPAIVPERDIFPVDPNTLVVGTKLGVYAAMAFVSSSYYFPEGPKQMLSSGSILWFDWDVSGAGHQYVRIDPSNPGGWTPWILAGDKFSADVAFAVGQFSTDGTSIFYAHPLGAEVNKFNMAGVMGVTGSCELTVGDTGVVMPMAVEYCAADTFVYAVCGGQWLMKCTSWTPGGYTTYNLGALVTNPDPFHIRYCASDGNLYIPCQGANTIIVWNPTLNSGTTKPGFDGPIDVVFAGSKKFAVQSGPSGLKEIT